MTLPSAPLPLSHLGVLAVRGVEARKFLQGQVSQDVQGLRDDRVEWAGLHNPQGRTLALLRLVPQGPTDVLCILPRELLSETLLALRKYLLRAKAVLGDESATWRITGLAADIESSAAPAATLATQPGSARQEADRILWRHASDGRIIMLQRLTTATESPPTDESAAAQAALDWQRADIAAGLPELTLRTHGQFVAQMLNLDALGGISFNKGCYTGQEVIARAHYRGRVKRRAQRFVLPPGTLPEPGEAVSLSDGRSAEVLLAAPVAAGIEILAVAPTVEHDPLALPLSYRLPE